MIVERLWKSLKYERVYLYAYDSVIEARKSIQKETAAAIQTKLNAAKQALEKKEHEAAAAKAKMEEFLGNKTAQTQAVVAEWKVNKKHKKLEKRADHAETYAESCVEMALYYADTAQVAILEAVAARKDANDAG